MVCKYIKNRSPRGFTIVEMLVAMGIAGIFMTIFAGVVMATFQTLRTGDERTAAQQNARVAIRFIVDDVKQAIEIAPRRLEEPRDPSDGGLPRDANSIDPFDPAGTDYSYPIFRRSTDADNFAGNQNTPGYIDLSYDGDGWEDDEYVQFRPDGRPYDIRPLAPNRLELMLDTNSYFSHTQFFGDDPETPVVDIREYNLDQSLPGGLDDNPQSLRTVVTFEHQIVPSKTDIYNPAFSENEKQFKIPVNRSGGLGVAVDDEFCIVRSFETEFLDYALNTDVIRQSDVEPKMYVDAYTFRQPLADHIIDMRFRYWYVENAKTAGRDPNYWNGNYGNVLEIRYDPDIVNAYTDGEGSSGTPIDTDDGYYRYFTQFGQEIYVWYDYDEDEMVEFVDESLGVNMFDPVQPYCFFMHEDSDPDWAEYERGVLLFEGWRFVNMISVTVRATNRENLNNFKATIDHTWSNPADNDYQMGFIDFGRGAGAPAGFESLDFETNENALDPFYRAVDNYRANNVVSQGYSAWDFVEPNINPSYDPNSFVTLEMFVVPPALVTLVQEQKIQLTYGLSYKGLI